MGKVISRYSILKSNIASLKAVSPFEEKIYAEARYLKLLWWEFWKEKPAIKKTLD